MIKKTVYSIPDKFEAVQYDGTADFDLAEWCNGAFRASKIVGEWYLTFGHHDVIDKGSWVVKNADGQFYGLPDTKFKDEFVEKVSYENQSS